MKTSAADLGYRMRWAYLLLWLWIAVSGISWLCEYELESKVSVHEALPSTVSRAVVDYVAGGSGALTARDLHGFMGMDLQGWPVPDIEIGRISTSIVLILAVGLGMLAFVPFRVRPSILPAKQPLTWRATIACAVMGGFIGCACVNLILLFFNEHESFMFLGLRWIESPDNSNALYSSTF